MLHFYIYISFIVYHVNSCLIQGYESGECLPMTSDVKNALKFCGSSIDYTLCSPKFTQNQEVSVSLNALKEKDNMVKDLFNKEWDRMKRLETDASFSSDGQLLPERFYGGRDADDDEDPWLYMNDCANAYKNFFCYANFPRCDNVLNSLPLCKSVCENYFTTCGYDSDMIRCGPSNFLNGEEVEEPSKNDRNEYVTHRAFLPGQPFINNRYGEDGSPIAICTPSLISAANRHELHLIPIATCISLLIYGLFYS